MVSLANVIYFLGVWKLCIMIMNYVIFEQNLYTLPYRLLNLDSLVCLIFFDKNVETFPFPP